MADFPVLTIAGDSVDPEMVDHPRRWNIGFIRRFMIIFGLISSVFDYLTFGVLLLGSCYWGLAAGMHVGTVQSRTGWFVESVCSASLIVLVVRTRQRFYQSRPSRPLLLVTLAVVLLVLLLPYTPLASALGRTPLPGVFLLALGGIVACSVIAVELAKALFYRNAAS